MLSLIMVLYVYECWMQGRFVRASYEYPSEAAVGNIARVGLSVQIARTARCDIVRLNRRARM
jgi:hypothetical protein